MLNKRTSLFALFFSVLLASHASAAITFISSCNITISQSGQYHLSQDISCPFQDGIIIVAPDVELHFDGHNLDGGGFGVDGVLVNAPNASIFGSGTVTGFHSGIFVDDGGVGA